MVTIHSIDTIVSDSNLFNGEPVIADTRIRVLDIVASHLYRGLTLDAFTDKTSFDNLFTCEGRFRL